MHGSGFFLSLAAIAGLTLRRSAQGPGEPEKRGRNFQCGSQACSQVS